MSAFAKIAFVVGLTLTLAPCHRSNADLMLLTIRAPKECPDGLTIKSKASNGMIEFDVSVDAEEIAHAGVKSRADLKVTTSEQQIASVSEHGATEGKRTRYQFSISPAAAKLPSFFADMVVHSSPPAMPSLISHQLCITRIDLSQRSGSYS